MEWLADNWTASWLVYVCFGISLFITWMVAGNLAHFLAERGMKSLAVFHGAGEWRLDSYGNKFFVWKDET